MASLADIIEPRAGLLAIQVDTKDEITPSGLFIPVETARSIHETKPTQGIVVAIGGAVAMEDDPDADLDEPVSTTEFEVGDRVIFGKYSGTEIKYQPPDVSGKRPPKERIIILQYKDILARFKVPKEAENVQVRG